MNTSNESQSLGIYGCMKKLAETYANQTTNPSLYRKKFLSKGYSILLGKSGVLPHGLPSDWDDYSLHNGILIEIARKSPGKWTESAIEKLFEQIDFLESLIGTPYYQNSVGPALRMLLCISCNRLSQPKSNKGKKRWFENVLPEGLIEMLKLRTRFDNLIFEEESHSSIARPLAQSSRFNFIFNQGEKLDDLLRKHYKQNSKLYHIIYPEHQSNDLDEGFVTPNEEHIEKTPCSELERLPSSQEQTSELAVEETSFNWDYEILRVPPIRHYTWDKYDLALQISKETSFMKNDAIMNRWLSSEPSNITKISKETLIDDLFVLLVGIGSSTFTQGEQGFELKQGVYTDELQPPAFAAFCKLFMDAGNAFNELSGLCELEKTLASEENDKTITLAFQNALGDYLYKYQSLVLSAKENAYSDTFCYWRVIGTVEPFVQEVNILHKMLNQPKDLRGVELLKLLFEYLRVGTHNTSVNCSISSIFLSPISCYVNIIDDWIFNGIWHPALPLSETDMTSVTDRNSWLKAYHPNTKAPKFISPEAIAHCGKVISLLNSFSYCMNFLSFLKSPHRLKMRICLNLDDLNVLEKECQEYYEKCLEYFKPAETPKVDLVMCAQVAAKKEIAKFKAKQLKGKQLLSKQKKDELAMREADLMRSASNKQLLKELLEEENERVIAEQEQILLKEQQEELQKSKVLLDRLNKHLVIKQKLMTRAEWTAKREQLNEKRKQLFSNDQELWSNVPKETVIDNQPNDSKAVAPLSDNIIIDLNAEQPIDNSSLSMFNSNSQVAVNEISETEKEVLCNDFDGNRNNKTMDTFLCDLEKNKRRVLGSHGLIDNYDFCTNTEAIQTKEITEIEKNKSKIMGSNVDAKKIDDTANPEFDLNSPASPVHPELSDLVKNRMKVLGTHFDKDEKLQFHVWSAEAERNKHHMLMSHLPFTPDSAYENHKKEKDRYSIETKEEKNFENLKINMANETYHNIEEQEQEPELEPVENEVETETFEQINKIPWTYKNFKMKQLFADLLTDKTENCISSETTDFTLLPQLVEKSLKTVINTQKKILDFALTDMILNKFDLLIHIQRLREYFFLHGEFGKRLTSLLSSAFEKEKPSSLLTFHKLQKILIKACNGGDVKEVSFIIKDTPIAFDHCNSQVLQCINLSYKMEWPLNLIFTEIAISKYNVIFLYVFSIQRVLWYLDEVCHFLHFNQSFSKGDQYTQLQLYRFVMTQFVNSLQSYIVTTVIENAYQDFLQSIQNVNTIYELYDKHAEYIRNIIRKCLLDERSKSIMKEIQKLLKLILVFCRTLLNGEWNVDERNNKYTHKSFKKLQSTFTSFFSQARYVTKSVVQLEDLHTSLTMNSFYMHSHKK